MSMEIRNCTRFVYPVQVSLPMIYVIGFSTTICFFCGYIGNIFAIKLALKLNVGKVLRTYMITLALWDTAVLLCTWVYYGILHLFIIFNRDSWQKPLWPKLVFGFHAPLSIAITGSTWTTLAIASTRYFIISRPIQSVTVQFIKQSGRASICILVCTIIYCLPCFFELQMESCIRIPTGIVDIQVVPSTMLINKTYQLIYRNICCLIFVSVGPFITILTMSVNTMLLLIKMDNRQGRSRRSVRPGRTRNHRKIGILLLVLLLKFIICHTIPVGLMLFSTIALNSLYMIPSYKILTEIGNILVLINSASNFVVYYWWKRYGIRRKQQGSTMTELERESSILSSAGALQFTQAESLMLLNGWQTVKDGNPNDLFERMLISMSEEHENVRKFTVDPAFIQNLSQKMVTFFDEVILEIGAYQNSEFPSVRIQQVGRIHYQKGVKVNNELLRNFEAFVLGEIFHQPMAEVLSAAQRSPEIQAWNRFISAVISEMKLGYLAAKLPDNNYLTPATTSL